MTNKHTLYYAHDPMCSWCWGFKPTWLKLKQSLPERVDVQYVVGGLAPDTNDPMPQPMQQMLQQTWQRIAQSIPGTQFNHDFWTQNSPRRATYPACRAVLAAKQQSPTLEEPMILAIQQAYYLHAKNPSEDNVLIEIAEQIGCDVNSFKESLNNATIADALKADLMLAQRLGAQGFPSLFFEVIGKTPVPLALSYTDNTSVLEQIDTLIAA